MEALRLEDHEASKSQHELQQRIAEQDGELRAVYPTHPFLVPKRPPYPLHMCILIPRRLIATVSPHAHFLRPCTAQLPAAGD
jgi:hypothetical protein